MTGHRRFLAAALCGLATMTMAGTAAQAGEAGRQVAPRATQVRADAPMAERLVDLARLGPLIQVVATEGARHGVGLEDALFPGRGGEAWARTVARIQSPERLVGALEETLAAELARPAMEAAVDFYATDLGARIAEREVTARRAMLDATVEADAMAAAELLDADQDGRAALVRELIDTLDLVTANVSGGLNANYAFYRGLGDGGAMRSRMTESEMLAMVWGQEADVRRATSKWLDAYLTLAYAPLSEEELRGYIDFVATAEGRKLSAALFTGFGRIFEETSYALGREAARFMAMQDT